MSWKKLSWLKGGIILALIYIISVIYIFLSNNDFYSSFTQAEYICG